jgi:prevent-host-death family protein
MGKWRLQDAKARFSEMLHRCLEDGPQVVSRRGEPAAVLVAMPEWQRLQRAARPTLKELLLSDEARADIPLPKAVQRWQIGWGESARQHLRFEMKWLVGIGIHESPNV